MMVNVASDLLPQLCDRDAWTGGFYELAIQLGDRDDVRLQAAVGILGYDASLEWRRPIDDWLARLADQVRQETGFRHAVIGFEVSGSVRAATVTDQPQDRPYALVLADGTYLPAAN